MQGLMAGRAYNKAYEACFLGKGYVLSEISPEDEKALKKTKKEDRQAWVLDYYTRRITQMKSEMPPPGASSSSTSSSSSSSASSSSSPISE